MKLGKLATEELAFLAWSSKQQTYTNKRPPSVAPKYTKHLIIQQQQQHLQSENTVNPERFHGRSQASAWAALESRD